MENLKELYKWFDKNRDTIIDNNINEWIKRLPIAHRGLHNIEFPENSIGAFLNAKNNGFAIELDVQLSCDNNIVVFHDEDTFRMTQETGNIKELNISQIKKRKLLNTNFEIPTLKEVFEIVGNETPLLIEVKNPGKVGKLESMVCSEIGNYKGICAVQSFNPFVLQYFKHKCPNILRGQLSKNYRDENMNIFKKIILENLLLNKITEPNFVSYRIDDLPKGTVSSLRRKDIPIIGWTITEENFNYAKKYCDNIIFEKLTGNVFDFYNNN